MTTQFARLWLIALGIVIGSCLVSLMVGFMGGGHPSPEVQGSLLLQVVAIPGALLSILVAVSRFVAKPGWSAGLKLLWQAVPPWMLFGFVMLNSLLVVGELAFYLVARGTENSPFWHEHIPLLAMLFCSSAFCAVFAMVRLMTNTIPSPTGRWSS